MTAEQKAATAATSSTTAKPTPEQGTEWIICHFCTCFCYRIKKGRLSYIWKPHDT